MLVKWCVHILLGGMVVALIVYPLVREIVEVAALLKWLGE